MEHNEANTNAVADKYRERRKKRKQRDAAIFCLTAVGVLFILLAVLTVGAIRHTTVYRGVYVAGVSLSGKTEQEAEAVLAERFGNDVPSVSVSVGEKTIQIPFSDIASYDFAETAHNAYQKGRGNRFSQFFTYATPFVKRNLPLVTTVNHEAMEAVLADLQSELPNGYKETVCTPQADSLIILTGHGGTAMDRDKIEKEIATALSNHKNAEITAELTKKAFEAPSAKALTESFAIEPKDAYFDEANRKIVAAVVGYELKEADVEQALRSAKPDTEYKVPLTVIQPEKTAETIEKELFGDKLGTYSTSYNAGQVDRSHNVALAAQKINNYIMLPGDVFSYNGVVGERTVAAGFRNAAVYTSNGVENGIGGGICQVSSTLYNAVLYSNLEIVSRRNHSYPVSYTPKGQDATVSMGSIDFQFRNNTNHPICLKTSVGGGQCVVSIYGKKDTAFSVAVESTVLSTTPYTTEYTDDPEMAVGEEKTVRAGITGYSVSTVRKVTVNGETHTEKMPASTYRMLPRKVIRGTKAAEPPVTDSELPTEVIPAPEVQQAETE